MNRCKKKQTEGQTIPSVERAIKALLLYQEDNSELGIKDFAERLDLPKPILYRIVNILTAKGFLEQNPGNARYRPGPVHITAQSISRQLDFSGLPVIDQD